MQKPSADGASDGTQSEYSVGYVRDLFQLFDDCSVGTGRAPLASGSEPEFEPRDFTSKWASDTPILPGQLLLADVYRQKFGTCIEGGYPHDSGSCICAVSENADGMYWTTPSGLTERGKRVLNGDSQDTDIAFTDVFGNTILHFLSARGSPVQLVQALKAGLDPRGVNTAGQSFLHLLGESWYANLTHISHLLECLGAIGHGECLQRRDIYGKTCFHIFSQNLGEDSLIELAKGAWITSQLRGRDAFGNTPVKPDTLAGGARLNPAIKVDDPASSVTRSPRSSMSAGELFIASCMSQPYLEDIYGRTGLHYAAVATLCDIAPTHPWMAQRGDDPANDPAKGPIFNPWYFAPPGYPRNSISLRECLTRALVAHKVDVNGYDLLGNTVLMAFVFHLPCSNDDETSIRILHHLITFAGADVSARNRKGETALHIAARRGWSSATRLLIQSGANPNSKDHGGASVLQVLAERLKNGNDESKRAHHEACFAWLSGESAGRLEPSTVQEWTAQQRLSDPLEPSSEILLGPNFKAEFEKLLCVLELDGLPAGRKAEVAKQPRGISGSEGSCLRLRGSVEHASSVGDSGPNLHYPVVGESSKQNDTFTSLEGRDDDPSDRNASELRYLYLASARSPQLS